MPCFLVLLRGINVGATRKLPMADLRSLCLEVGFQRPETYIQSGNLLIDHAGDVTEVAARLAPAIEARFGFPVDLVCRDISDWPGYIGANPFSDAAPAMLHLYLAQGAIPAAAAQPLLDRARDGERIAIAANALWIDYAANGVHRSKLTPSVIDRACGGPATGRNWNSVLKLADMICARGLSVPA